MIDRVSFFLGLFVSRGRELGTYGDLDEEEFQRDQRRVL